MTFFYFLQHFCEGVYLMFFMVEHLTLWKDLQSYIFLLN